MNDLMQQANLIGLGAALVTGFLFSFNPASFATVPVVLAYVTKGSHYPPVRPLVQSCMEHSYYWCLL